MIWNKQFIKYKWAEFTLSKLGYDPLIDYLKGLCIIFVIVNHCMPEEIMDYSGFFFWGVSAVPIFLILQVFHAYKKGTENAKPNFTRIWKRIVWPYLLAELAILVVYIIRDHHFKYNDIILAITNLIKSGGYGPGAYYPFIYLQFAVIIPIITQVFKLKNTYLCFIFIIISQFSETACSYFHLSQIAYRLLFLRYIFILYLGFLLARKGFILNLFTFSIACISLGLSSYLVYSHQSFRPVLYDFVNPVCHWFCYLYISFLLLFILKKSYYLVSFSNTIKEFILKAGKYSYEIFIFQIVYFAIADCYWDSILNSFISNKFIYVIVKITLPIILCTTPIIIYKEILWKEKS